VLAADGGETPADLVEIVLDLRILDNVVLLIQLRDHLGAEFGLLGRRHVGVGRVTEIRQVELAVGHASRVGGVAGNRKRGMGRQQQGGGDRQGQEESAKRAQVRQRNDRSPVYACPGTLETVAAAGWVA
jgi:hypothetical protein